MHQELDRPLRANAEETTCECSCKASVREGETNSVENARQSNFLATKNQIGG